MASAKPAKDEEWTSIIHISYDVVSNKVARGDAFDLELAETLGIGADYQVNAVNINGSYYVFRPIVLHLLGTILAYCK